MAGALPLMRRFHSREPAASPPAASAIRGLAPLSLVLARGKVKFLRGRLEVYFPFQGRVSCFIFRIRRVRINLYLEIVGPRVGSGECVNTQENC